MLDLGGGFTAGMRLLSPAAVVTGRRSQAGRVGMLLARLGALPDFCQGSPLCQTAALLVKSFTRLPDCFLPFFLPKAVFAKPLPGTINSKSKPQGRLSISGEVTERPKVRHWKCKSDFRSYLQVLPK
jgi:hypothetical protein